MAHFAQIDAYDTVLSVIVIDNTDIAELPFPQSELTGVAFCQALFGADTVWKQTSYNGSFRREYAAIGGFFYGPLDVFVGLKTYPSWTFQASDATWQPPVPKPTTPENYVAVWNEDYLEWDIIFIPGNPA